MGTLKIGLIGTGFISGLYRLALDRHPTAKITFVADPDARARGRFQSFRSTRDPKELIASKDVDCVCILTPHHLHASDGILALRFGKHVIIEKPIAIKLADADELLRIAESRRRHVIVRHYLRSAPFTKCIKMQISENRLGNVYNSSIEYATNQLRDLNRKGQWRGTWDRAGGGVLMDIGIHSFDLLRYLFGNGEVSSCITRQTLTRGQRRSEDTAAVIASFGQSLLARLWFVNCDTTTSSPRWRWEFIGTRGRVEVAGDWKFASLTQTTVNGSIQRAWKNWWEEANVTSIRNSIETVLYSKPDYSSAVDARENLRLVLSAYSKGQSIESRPSSEKHLRR